MDCSTQKWLRFVRVGRHSRGRCTPLPFFALEVLDILDLVGKLGLSFTDRQVEALNLFVELEKRLIETVGDSCFDAPFGGSRFSLDASISMVWMMSTEDKHFGRIFK